MTIRVDQKWLTDTEIDESKRRTRESSNRPRVHHFVPQMYLKRWRPNDGTRSKLIRFTNMDTRETDLRNPEKLANEPYFYQIVGDDVDSKDVPDLWFEIHMSRIENDAANWLNTLTYLPDGQIRDPELITSLAVFVGLQSQRTVKARQGELAIDAGIQRFGARDVFSESEILVRACHVTGRRYDPARHDELAQEIADEVLNRRRVSEAPDASKARAIESAIGVWRNQMVPHLVTQRTWWLLSTATPIATCDEPVIYIGSRLGRGRANAFTFGSAPLVLFPIGPARLIALAAPPFCQPTPPFKLDSSETRDVNFEIAAGCRTYVYERDGTDIARTITVPRRPEFDPATANTFWESVNPPTRWSNRQGPSWPLQRWSRGWQPARSPV